MAGRINTTAVLNNGWNSGGNDQVFQGAIAVHPDMEKVYDYALTSDPVLLQERKQIQEELYEIFKNSPFYKKYCGMKPSESDDSKVVCFAKKVEKSDIEEIFYYMKKHLEEKQQYNISELVMQICEFFDFSNYKYVIESVLTIPLQAKLFKEIYGAGHKKIIDEAEALF